MIPVDEIRAVHERLPPLFRAIDATGDDRAQQLGIVLHALLLGFTVTEREFAFSYLCNVIRQSLH
jgi:hypothetical protein